MRESDGMKELIKKLIKEDPRRDMKIFSEYSREPIKDLEKILNGTYKINNKKVPYKSVEMLDERASFTFINPYRNK